MGFQCISFDVSYKLRAYFIDRHVFLPFLYIKEDEEEEASHGQHCIVHECFSNSIIQYRPSPSLFLSAVVVSARISVWQSDRQFVKSPILVSLPFTVYSIYFEVWSRAESYERIDPLEDHHSYRVCLYSIVVWNFTALQSLPLYIYIYATGSFRWWCYSTVLRAGLQPYQKEVMLRSPLKAMEWRLERSNGAICRARFNSLDSHSQSIKDERKSLLWWFLRGLLLSWAYAQGWMPMHCGEMSLLRD